MRRVRKKGTSSNRGGTKVEYDGILFNSKLEVFAYKELKKNGLEAHYEPETYVLVEPFRYDDKAVLAMKYTPDFVDYDYVMETKGFANESFPLRWKLFKKYLYDRNIKKKLYKPKNQTQVKEAVADILKRRGLKKPTTNEE